MDYSFIKRPEDLLKIKPEDVTKSLYLYVFGNREKFGPRFKRNHKLVIEKDQYVYGNKERLVTCVGNYLTNISLFNENLYKVLGFVNKRLSSNVIGDINSKLETALQDDIITPKDAVYYLDRIQYYGFSLNAILSPSLTEKTMFALPEVEKRKQELAKKYSKELAAGDIVVADKMERELMDLAKSIIGDDPGMELYESGSKASFSNNYKLMNIMKGALQDPETGKFAISTSNYETGVKRDEMHMYATNAINNEYQKGVGTQTGGYLVKKYIAAFQSVVLDPDRTSDCGTTKTFRMVVNKFNKKLLEGCFIKEGNKTIQLTKDNIDSYVGKTIEKYDIIHCKGEKPCHKCAGEKYYKVGIMNIGATTTKICSTIMNKALKKKHDNTIKFYRLTEIGDDMVL